MPTIYYDKLSIKLKDDETILDGLLRNDIDYPNSCKSGVCQLCMCQLSKGDI